MDALDLGDALLGSIEARHRFLYGYRAPGREETHCGGAAPKADGRGDPAARLLLTPIASANIVERSAGERHG
jgi:hypothetical protein